MTTFSLPLALSSRRASSQSVQAFRKSQARPTLTTLQLRVRFSAQVAGPDSGHWPAPC